jgi:type III secretory pathway component EscS
MFNLEILKLAILRFLSKSMKVWRVMNQDFIISIMEKATIRVIILSMPQITTTTLVSLIIGFLQALMQIQEQPLNFAIKLTFTILILILSTYWIREELLSFPDDLFIHYSMMIR